MSRAGWGAALCVAAWGWGSAQAGDLPIRRIVRDSLTRPEPKVFVGPGAVVGHVPSARNVLKLDRAHPLGLPTAESAALQKTVRVAVLRVQFALETPDDPRSTGRGHLDLRDSAVFLAEEGHAFETAPHNRDFFNTVMRAMAQYYDVISNGRLIVNYDVFPTARDSAYTLDSNMCAYGSLPPNEGLAYLLIDAVLAADPDPDFVFSDYDVIMIFHAGSDAQHDFSPVTPTPCDLYSAFVRLLDTALFVPVDGGAAFVEEGLFLPETQTQDNRGTGLNGVTAHEFGHALGLVDIYSTRTGTTQVGDFSLMDNNAQQVGIEFGVDWEPNTFFDLLPVLPDAWSRAYLGFIDPVVATPDSILARDHTNPDSVRPYILNVAENGTPFTQILKVPISAREYYLAEFRSPDQDLNANPSVPGDQGVGIRFDSSFNCVLGPSTCNPASLAELDSCRVLGRDYDFQFFQPGQPGGLLIWHVDEEVGYQSVPEVEADPYLINNFQANTLQWDRFRRFLEIEEADGLVDFGGNYFTYYGGQRELFSGSGNDEFGPSTNPSTRSHTGAPSGLRLFDISPVRPPNSPPNNLPLYHMTLKVRRESAVKGWPRSAGPSSAPQLTVISDTVLASSGRYVLAWRKDGTSLLTQLPGDLALAILPKFDQTFDTLRLSGWAKADTTLATAPSVGTDQGGGLAYVSAVDVNGKVYIWAFADANVDGWADTVSTRSLAGRVPQPPVWFDSDGNGREELFVSSETGDGAYFDGAAWSAFPCGSVVRDWCLAQPGNRLYLAADGGLTAFTPPTSVTYTSLGRTFLSLLAMDSDRDGTDELFARDASQLHRIDISSAPSIADQNDPRFNFHGPLTAGDHDGNGTPSVFCGAGEFQTGFQPNLTLETGFPVRSNDYYPGDPVTEAVVTDGALFFGGADGEVQAYGPDRSNIAGWPLFAGDTVVSVVALRSSADSATVLARSTSGTIWAQKAAARSDVPGVWVQSRGNAAKTNRWEGTGVALPTPGTTSLPKESVFAYPNPAARGPVAIRFYLGESSTVELRIYDLAGNEITRSETSGTGGMDNEWIWDASGIAPGVYFCRVQAMQGGKEVVEFCKVAITP